MKVSVHPYLVGDKTTWCVSRRESGKRKRTFFKTKAEANSEADRIRLEVRDAGHSWFALPAKDRQTLMLAYVEAQKRGLDLLELARGAITNGVSSVGLGAVITELIEAKEKSGNSPKYGDALRIILGQFARGREELAFGKVTLADVETFLDSKPAASRSTLRSRLSTLFRFGIRRGYRPDNPCERLEPVRVVRSSPEIFSVKQLEICLEHLKQKPALLPWFVLSTLCGLRPEEAQQTRKSDIHIGEGWVKVESATSKVRQRRIVYPKPEAMALLKTSLRKGKLPINATARRRAMRKLRDILGFKRWPKDISRHSCASYWLADCNDTAHLANMLGNSESILLKHYRALVTKKQAKEFWAIVAGKKKANQQRGAVTP